MALAATSDVAARLGRDLTAGESVSVAALLNAATANVAEAAGKDDDWATALDPVPQALRFLTVDVACRAMANPNQLGSLSETVGSYVYSARFTGDGLALTDAEQRFVRRVVNGFDRGSSTTESVMDDVWPWPYPWPLYGFPYGQLEDADGDGYLLSYWLG